MKSRVSDYEEKQVNRFLDDLYLLEGRHLKKEECIVEGWIVYLDGRKRYRYSIADSGYWTYVQKNVLKRFKEMRKARNEKIRLESRLSLNQKVGDSREEIGTLIVGKCGDFANNIVLWDYVSHLGKVKYDIVRLMYNREEDRDIMTILKLEKPAYLELKRQLEHDFRIYLGIE